MLSHCSSPEKQVKKTRKIHLIALQTVPDAFAKVQLLNVDKYLASDKASENEKDTCINKQKHLQTALAP